MSLIDLNSLVSVDFHCQLFNNFPNNICIDQGVLDRKSSSSDQKWGQSQ